MTFATKLTRWYRKNARELPWRETSDPYCIWVSEVMLQQTTVSAVVPYYLRWIKIFPTIVHVAKSSEQKILKSWQGLGYYQRAKNFHKAAKMVMRKFGGKLPGDPEKLKLLPGFGPYTVGAVSSIAFGIRHAIIDANVRRVIMRMVGIEGAADYSKDLQIYDFLNAVMPKKGIGDFNQGLMELGALVCRSRSPQCHMCPLQGECVAFKKGKQDIIPEVRKKKITNIDVVVGVICHKNKIFIQQRTEKGLLNGLWEFPGGKIKRDETPLKVLKREVLEEVGVAVRNIKHLITVRHYYTRFAIKIRAYLCETTQSLPNGKAHRLVSLNQFKSLPMPSGTVKIVNYLRQNF